MAELLFVYNADSGLLNSALDTLHKTLSPATYACSLCAVTYGATSMRPEWRTFLRDLPVNTTFLHRDELRQRYPSLLAEPLPAIFRRETNATAWQVFLTARELKPLDLPGLILMIKGRLPMVEEGSTE
ncbi:hypothetical protein DNI29_21175 [Hymenobacter sediminis]|uniref:hypothetical protein n=1 Tax=Hymenobacter sediminis TaxID=2218621 RepID=UPI000DA6429B|nr:hypothetical protein [Hymenobacter sediminis]RPD44643.1 hypothetical protein DNI29_21175 [Hymenobacter sediminis]